MPTIIFILLFILQETTPTPELDAQPAPALLVKVEEYPGEALEKEKVYRQRLRDLAHTERQIWDMEERYILTSNPLGNLLRGTLGLCSKGSIYKRKESSADLATFLMKMYYNFHPRICAIYSSFCLLFMN